MRRVWDRMQYNGLFVKMFVVMVVSLITVTLLTSWITIRMSERLFMNTFSITNSKIINQIKTNFESFNYGIITVSNNVLQSGSVRGFLTKEDKDTITTTRTYYSATQKMKQISSNLDPYEVGITILGVNGNMYTTDSTKWPMSVKQLRAHPITIQMNADPKRLIYQFSSGTTSAHQPVIVATKALYDRVNSTLYGNLYIAIRESAFKQFYTNFTSEGNDVVIMNKSGVIVSSNLERLIGNHNSDMLADASEIVKQGLSYKDTRVMGKDYIILSEYLPTYDFYVINLIDKKTALNHLVNTRAITLICAGIVLVALLIIFIITRRITRSLSLLVRQMSKVTKKTSTITLRSTAAMK